MILDCVRLINCGQHQSTDNNDDINRVLKIFKLLLQYAKDFHNIYEHCHHIQRNYFELQIILIIVLKSRPLSYNIQMNVTISRS